jgi:hypothetical protein
MASPEENEKFVAFIASPQCRWLTGCCIHYDGGSNASGGEFQGLKEVTPEEWKMLEAAIRKTAAKQAKGEVKKSKL